MSKGARKMPTPEQVQAVADIRDRLEGAEAVFLTEYRGLTVKAVQELRRSLRASGADYKVVKMTLTKLAAEEAGFDGMADFLSGPTAVAFAQSDPAATAMALKDFSRTHSVFVVKAGFLSGSILTPEEISKLADMQPRDVLLAMIAGAAKAPLFKAAGMFGSFTRDAASMFSQLLDKKESGDHLPEGGTTSASLPSEEPPETAAETAEEE